MPDWLIITFMCSGLGYWIATKYQLDGKVGCVLGFAFGILFNGGLYHELSKYDSSMKLLLVGFATLLCLAFFLLLQRKTVVAWLKLASLTLLLSALSSGVFLSGLDYRTAQSKISAAAKDPVGTFNSLTKELQTKYTREPLVKN